MFGETAAGAALANAPVQVTTSADTLVVTALDASGRAWQQVLSTGYDVPPLSGWYRPLAADPGFPAVAAPSPLRSGEVVQSWNLTPMQTGIDQWYTEDGTDPVQNSANHVLAVVKTNQRILAVPMPSAFGTIAQPWRAVLPGTGGTGAFPTTSDGEPLQVMFDGHRQHQIVLDDADGSVFVIDVNDSALGACAPSGDSGCPSGTGWAVWPMNAAAVSPTNPPSSRYGDTTHLLAPPVPDYQPLENRWVLTGQSRGGHTVQNTWDPQRAWSGWYACEVNADCPAVGGYVDHAWRIASAEADQDDATTETVWTRLVRLTSKRLALEIHLGGVEPDHTNLQPVRAFGEPVDLTMLDTPTPVVNSDRTITLMAPVMETGKTDPSLAVANLDPATNRLTPWTISAWINPGLGTESQTLGAVAVTALTTSGTTRTGTYTLAWRGGTGHTLRVVGARVSWNTTAISSLDIDNYTALGGEVLSAPALAFNPHTRQVVIAVNGRNGIYFQTVVPNATGGVQSASGYGGAYQLPAGQGKIDPAISPNISLDEANQPQITVVSDRGNATIGWVTNPNATLDHGIATATAWQWDNLADDLSKTTSSVALFTPDAGIRQIVTNNTNNNSVDYRRLENWVWTTTVTPNPTAATNTGDATTEHTSYRDYL